MLIVEFARLEIGSAAERYSTSVAKYFPKPLRALYRGGRALELKSWSIKSSSTRLSVATKEVISAMRSHFQRRFASSLPVRNEA